MALKDCIRARTLASAPGAAQGAHIPYRRSKLTTLLKDVFDPGASTPPPPPLSPPPTGGYYARTTVRSPRKLNLSLML
jgi:hypothetical protein